MNCYNEIAFHYCKSNQIAMYVSNSTNLVWKYTKSIVFQRLNANNTSHFNGNKKRKKMPEKFKKVIIIMWIVDNTRNNMKLYTFYRLVQCAEIKCTVYPCLLQFIRMFDHIAKCIVYCVLCFDHTITTRSSVITLCLSISTSTAIIPRQKQSSEV